MTAPNTETTSLAKSLADFNPDGILSKALPQNVAQGNATVLAANLVNGILNVTQTANMTLTTDTAANIAAQIGSDSPVNACFDFNVICANNAANTAITVAGGNGVTIVGNATVPLLTSATFRVCLSSSLPTFNAYRI